MEEYTQITLDMWMKWKEEIRTRLQDTAVNFVAIGYRLRQIQEFGMMDGAADIYEFAEKEYGISKSTTSRFIAISERYGDPETPMSIREKYRNFTTSKLSEMLTLTDEECEMITEKTTVSQIRALKKFEKAELEENDSTEEAEYSSFQKCVIKWFEEKEGQLNRSLSLISRAAGLEGEDKERIMKEIAEEINPSTSGMCQKGTIFIFFYEYDKGIKYRDAKKKTSEQMTYEEFAEIMKEIYGKCMEMKNPYDAFYRAEKTIENNEEKQPEIIENTESEAVATSQQKKEKPEEKETAESEYDEQKNEPDIQEQKDISNPDLEIEPDPEDTATEEEEQKNAKKLHVLKMLEKYYPYIMDDEQKILETILQDCKRRKREYGIEDVGSTV